MKNKKLLLFILIPICLIALAIGVALLLPSDDGTDADADTDTDTDVVPHVHAFSAWAVTDPATCIKAGEQVRTCLCGEIEREQIGIQPHSPSILAEKEPTPTEEGLTEGEACSVCGLVFKEQIAIPRVMIWDGTVADAFAGGSGTESDPYLIECGTQLALLAQMANTSNDGLAGLYFKLIQNVHLGELEWTPIGTNQDHYFSANFDGNGKTIYTFKITDLPDDQWYMRCAGVFGYANGATIENLKVTDFVLDVKAENFLMAGGIAGYLINSKISDCSANGAIYFNEGAIYAGLLAGHAEQTEISNCTSQGTITSEDDPDYCIVGGLIGLSESCSYANCTADVNISGISAISGALCGSVEVTTLTHCSASGSIFVTDNTYMTEACMGGLIGDAASSTLEHCFSTVSVTAGSDYIVKAGGLIGKSTDNTVLSCYATGDVSITKGTNRLYAGGFIGYSQGGTSIQDSSATGDVNISVNESHSISAGGLVGDSGGEILRCYATGNVLAKTESTDVLIFVYAGGLVGQSDNTAIDSCYATGNATAIGSTSVYAGGLVAHFDVSASQSLYRFYAKHCYATGNATVICHTTEPNYPFACAGGLLGDCGVNWLEGCLAIGNASAEGFGEYEHAAAFSYRFYIYENGTLFAYDGQTFTVDGAPSENDSEKTVLPCSAADLSSADFYKNSLRFDENVWDLSDLDFESGKLPTLKTAAHAE